MRAPGRLRSLATLSTIGVVLLPTALFGQPPDVPAPAAVVSDTSVRTGSVVVVSGSDFEPESIVKLEICGNDALDGSVDCDQRSSLVVRIWTTSELVARITVTEPPKPCPCGVRISRAGGEQLLLLPIEIDNVPIAPPRATSSAPPELRVTSATIEGGATFSSVFGGPAERTLVLIVENDSPLGVAGPVLTAGWGKNGKVDHVIPTPDLEPFAPRETREIRMDFSLDSLSVGSYQVSGRIGAQGALSDFEASTSTWPIGMFVLIDVLVFVVLLFLARTAIRRWTRKKTAETSRDPSMSAAESPSTPNLSEEAFDDHDAAASGDAGAPPMEEHRPDGDGVIQELSEADSP